MRRALLLSSAVALAGCNAIFGLSEVELRGASSGASGGGTASGTTSSTSASGPGAGGAGGRECHDPTYDPGLVTDGSFEAGWNSMGVFSVDWGNEVLPLCQDNYYALAIGEGPPPAVDYIWSDAVTGKLTTEPCLEWSIAARDPLGTSPHIWMGFDITGTPANTASLVTSVDGFALDSFDWKFYSGRCKLAVPTTPTGAAVTIWVEKGLTVHLDALEMHTIACDASIPDCTPY